MQNGQWYPCSSGSTGLGSGMFISIGRFARPGTVQTSVPEKGLACFTVPSAIIVIGGINP